MAVEAVIRAIADAATILRAGCSKEQIVDELFELSGETLNAFLQHVHWPSRLTHSGEPLEIVLGITDDGRQDIRVLLDAENHCQWLPGNWQQLLDTSAMVTGAAEQQLWHRMIELSAATATTARSVIYHCLRYGPDSGHNGSIYYFIDNLVRDFSAQFPRELQAIRSDIAKFGGHMPERYHLFAEDYLAAEVIRHKFYAWLDFTEEKTSLYNIFGQRAEFTVANKLLESLCGGDLPPQYSTKLQTVLRPGDDKCAHKIYLNCYNWGLDHPELFIGTTSRLASDLSVDLHALHAVMHIFNTYEIPLRPSWVGISGSGERGGITLYFTPMLEIFEIRDKSTLLELVEELIRKAIDYVRAAGRFWIDLQHTQDARGLTATVVAALSAVPEASTDLSAMTAYLEDCRTEHSPQTIGALAKLGHRNSVQQFDQFQLAQLAPTDVACLMIADALSTSRFGSFSEKCLVCLENSEQWAGGWEGRDGGLRDTTIVVDSLVRINKLESAPTDRIIALLRRASYRFSEYSVAADPTIIGPWLKGWLLTKHNPVTTSVLRAISCFTKTQQSDGRWLSTPTISARGDCYITDPTCLATTAAAVEALQLLRSHLQ